jgi:4-amino-4-deoxy-L-arabinose transferase-like glycosyltransferase
MDEHKGVRAFRAFQAVLQTLSLLLIFLIGRELFNSTTALLACVLDAVYLPEIANSGLILTEIEFKFLLLLLSYISLRAIKSKDLKLYILSGFVWGLACLFRPTIATFPLVVFIMWLLHRYTLKEMLKYGLVASAVFCIVMTPWWIRNYNVFDRFIPLTLSSGNPFLQGTYINYDSSVNPTPYRTKDLKPLKAGTDAITLNEVEMETGKYRLKTYFRKYPLQYIYWYTIGKTKYMWNEPYYWRAIYRISDTVVRRYHLFLLAASLLGAAFVLKKKHLSGFLPLLLILYMTIMHLPFFTFSRYAYPVMPMVILLAAYGLTAAAQAIIRRLPQKT